MVLDQRSARNVPALAAPRATALPPCPTVARGAVHPLPASAPALGAHPARVAASWCGHCLSECATRCCPPPPAPVGQPAGAPGFVRRATPSACGAGHGGSAGVGGSGRGKTTPPCHGTQKEREGA